VFCFCSPRTIPPLTQNAKNKVHMQGSEKRVSHPFQFRSDVMATKLRKISATKMKAWEYICHHQNSKSTQIN